MNHLIKIYIVCKFSYFPLQYLTLLHSEWSKLHSFDHSECNRVKKLRVDLIYLRKAPNVIVVSTHEVIKDVSLSWNSRKRAGVPIHFK